MDLSDKQITISMLAINSFPPQTKATVSVNKEVLEGVFQTIGSYELVFNETFGSIADPALQQAIYDKLSLIP